MNAELLILVIVFLVFVVPYIFLLTTAYKVSLMQKQAEINYKFHEKIYQLTNPASVWDEMLKESKSDD